MIYIYQILGTPDYKKVNFRLNLKGNSGEKCNFSDLMDNDNSDGGEFNLSSLYIFNKLRENNKKIIFLKPITIDKLTNNIKNDFGLDDSQYEIVETPAFGVYKGITYDFYPNEILLFFYFDMLKRVKKNDIIMIDINTGLNEYVNLLISALSYFIVTKGLENIMDEKIVDAGNAYEIIMDPIMGQREQPYNTYINEFKRKVFFSLPYTSTRFSISSIMEMDNSLKRDFESEFGYKGYYGNILEYSNIIFNAISNNALPFLYEIRDIIDENTKQTINSIIDEILKNIGDAIKPEKGNRSKKVGKSGPLMGFIMTLKFYCGLIDLLHDNIDDLHDLNKLEGAAKKIYENKYINLEINERFLLRDINDLKNATNTGKVNNKTGDEKRNFFAHSGMEYNAIDSNNGKIEYKKECIDKIKGWLLKP